MFDRKRIFITAVLFSLTLGSLYGADNSETVKVKGLITDRAGESLTVKTPEGDSVIVVITDFTKVQKPKGLGLRKTQMSFTALMPGLKISVDGTHDEQNRVMARTITFSGDDLRTAETIQAGLAPTQAGVEANKQNIETNKVQLASHQEKIAANEQEIEDVSKRFSDLKEFDTKGEASIYFASGSTTISAKDKLKLKELSRQAVNLTGYIVQVKGFADSTGNFATNQKLSMDRAQEIIAFLIQECNVPVRRIVAPGAMGISNPVAPNETAEGRAANRRVEIKVLVNRGLAGGSL